MGIALVLKIQLINVFVVLVVKIKLVVNTVNNANLDIMEILGMGESVKVFLNFIFFVSEILIFRMSV